MVFGCRVLRLSLRWYYSFLLKLLIRGTEQGGRIIGFASFVETIKFTYASLYYWVLYCYNPAQLRTSLRENREKLEMRIRNPPSFFALS